MKKITIKFLIIFYLLFIFVWPVKSADRYNYYNPVTDPETGIISYTQESYTKKNYSTAEQTKSVPIPANRKCYFDIKLKASCSGWNSDASSVLYENGKAILYNNNSWSSDVYHTSYSIKTRAYHGLWGSSVARATVKIYPYFIANISVQNPNCGAIYVNNTSYQPDRNYEYKAGTSISLRAEANPGCAFIRWEGSVSSTSPTINIIMNQDKTIKAVFADIYVDDVTSSDTSITYLGRDIRIEWSDVIDVSGIKEYQVMITETNQAPTNPNGLLTTVDSALVLEDLSSKKVYYAWVRAVDNANNISKNWLQIGPFSPAPESSEFLACTPQAKIVNDQPYYEVDLSLKDVDATKFIIQRRLVSSTEWLKKEFTSNELKASSFRYIDRDNLTKHAQYQYRIYTENALGLSSDEVLYNQIVTIPNIISYQIVEPQDGMVTNKTKYFFDVIPKIDLEGDEIRFRVLYSLINDEKVYTSSEVLKEEEVNLTFSSEGEWEWWLEIAEYDQGILIPGSEQVTETRTLLIDRTVPTGELGFKSLIDTKLSGYTNNKDIKLSNIVVKDQSGTVNSGITGIYLWNGRTRPTDFYPVELADLPDAINENILSPLATGAQGVYIEIASSLESPLFEETIEEIPWRLSSGSDGERSVSMEIVDLAGNISIPVEKSITIDTTPPADPTFNPCTFDGSKLVFNWYLLDKDADLEAFYVKQVDGSIERVAKVQDEHINNQYNGSFEIVIDYENAQQYNQPVKIEIYATDLAGNKSAVVNFTGYTKAKLGEEGILTAGYNEEYKHYFTLPVTGGIAKEQTLEISKDPNFETIDKIVRLEADDLFVVSELNPHGEYFYRLVATNHDGVRTLGLGKKYNVPNQPPPTPENLSPVGFASTDVKFIFNKVNEDSDGDSLTYQVYWDEGENNSFKPVDWDEEQACFSVTISPSDHGKTFNWYVEVDDGHGPIIKSELATFVLDANAPILKLKKPNTVYTSQQELEFTVSDDLSGLQKIEYQLTDAATNNLIGEVQTLDPTAGSILLPEGYYHLTVTAIDKAGNQTTEQVNNLRVDRTSPQLSEVVLSLPSNGSKYLTNTPQIPLTWKAVDAQSGIKGLLYWVQTDLGQPLGKAKYMALSPSGGTYALSIDLDAGNGSYYLALAALDRAGNQSAPEQIPMPILLDTTPPEVVFELAGFHNQGADFYLTPDNKLAIKEVGQQDPESGIAEKRFIVVETGSNKVITDSANWTEILDTTFISGKSYQIIYRVTNKVGLSTEVRSVEFTYDHTPPEGLSLKLPQTPLAKGEIASFLAAATEQETRIVRYQLGIGSAYDKRELSSLIPGNSDGWISINTANTSTEFRVEIPESDDGTYYLTLVVENAAGLRSILNAGTIVIDNHQERIIVNDQGPYSMFDDRIIGFWYYAGTKEIKAYQYRLIDENGNEVPNAGWCSTTEQSVSLTQIKLTEGNTYRFEVQAIFTDDTESASGFSPGVTVDTTGPVITALETPKFTTSWDLSFQWEGEDSESGISRIQAALGSNYYQTDLTKGWVDVTGNQVKLFFDANGDKLHFDLEKSNRYYLTLRLVNGAGLSTELASSCIIIDDTPPPTPVVADQGSYINTSIHQPFEANWFWTPEDKESGNAEYKYAILKFGESVTEKNVWHQGDERKSFSLTMEEFPRLHGETYYVAVKVTNGAGLSTIGYSDGIMVDEDAPILTKVVLLEAANLGNADAPEVNYITDNKDLGLWIDSYDPDSDIDSYLYTWGEQELVDENERLISNEELIELEHPEIAEGVITVFLGETKNGAEIESATGYTTGVVFDPGAPKIHSVHGCLSGNSLLFDWEVEESVSPVVRYEYVLVTETEYSSIMNNENHVIPWKTAPDLSKSLVIEASEITDGRYYLVVRGYNAAGTYSRNQGETKEWGTSPLLTIDRTPPVILEKEFKTPRYVDKVLTVRVGAEDALSGIHSYQYALGRSTDLFIYSQGWIDVENNNSLVELPKISTEDLPHDSNCYLMVRVKDNVGLWSEAMLSPVITIDHTKPVQPEVNCGSFTTNKSQVTGVAFHSHDPESGITHYRLGIVTDPDEGEWLFAKVVEIKDDTEIFTDLTFDQLALEEAGRYYLAVETRNGAGVWSETGISTFFLVDTIPPELTFTRAGETVVLNQPPLDIEYELTEDSRVEFTVLGADGSLKLHTLSGKKGRNTFSFNESKPQRYTLKAKVTDLAGNTGEEKEQLIRVNAPPQITLPVEINTTPGAPTRFTAMIYDPDGQEGDTFEYLWDPGDGSTEIAGEEAEHRYNNTITDYTLTLRVKDKDGGMAEATTTVKVRNTARGLLYMDECWSGEHRLYGDVTVPESITLTIMPGTEVIVDGIPGDTGYEHTLFIKGSLEIQGDSLGVTFHSVTEKVGGWKGIYLEGQARIDGLSLMQAVRGLTVTETAELTVTNSIFHNNLIGIHCYGSYVVILNTRFTNNAWYGLKEDAGGRPEVRDCIFSVNGTHYYHAGKTDLTAVELNALESNAGNQYE